MIINKAYKYRIYPNKEQQVLLEKHFGATRWVYNYALEKKIKTYKETNKGLSRFQLQKDIPILKNNEETRWLKEVNSQSLQYSLLCLDNAFTKFFREKKGFPNFKNKHGKQSFTCPQFFSTENNKLFIPKFKKGIKIKLSQEIIGKQLLCTISKTKTNKYFVSIVTEQEKEIKQKKISKKTAIGIDLGIKDFLITSKGDRFSNPKFTKKYEMKLANEQIKLSKKKKGSKNREKQKLRVARVHEKIRNSRADFSHKVTRQLVNESQVNTYCLEDLNISGMLRNHKLAKSIADVSWYEFVRQLTYKAGWVGKNITHIGRFEPSSKMCSNCGKINQDLQLKDREWVCKECGTKHDRDINAAKNILDFSFYKNETKTNKEYTVGTTEINASGEKSTVAIQENSLIEESPVFRQG
jgi:putative transposase